MAENRIGWSYFLNVSNFLKNNKAARGAMSSTDKAMGALKKSFGLFGAALGARELLRWTGDAIQLGAAAEEVDSKFESVYGTAQELTDELRAWGDMAGVTTTKAKDLAATFGNLAMAQGLSEDATKDLVAEVAVLAGDLASFNDADPGQVFENLTKGILTTERESLKPLGIAITETAVKTGALAIATADGRTEITQADRAMASYQIAVRQAGKAVGDLERTQDSEANAQRRQAAAVAELKERIGRDLLPVWADLLETAEDTLPILSWLATALKGVATGIQLTTSVLDTQERGMTAWAKKVDAAGGQLEYLTVGMDSLRGSADELSDAIGTKLPQYAQDYVDAMDRMYAVTAGTTATADQLSVALGTKLPAYAQESIDKANALEAAMRGAEEAAAALYARIENGTWITDAARALRESRFYAPGGGDDRGDDTGSYEEGASSAASIGIYDAVNGRG